MEPVEISLQSYENEPSFLWGKLSIGVDLDNKELLNFLGFDSFVKELVDDSKSENHQKENISDLKVKLNLSHKDLYKVIGVDPYALYNVLMKSESITFNLEASITIDYFLEKHLDDPKQQNR